MPPEMVWIDLLGWMLVHSVWFITLIAGVTAVALFALRRQSAEMRYWVGTAALALSASMLPGAFVWELAHRQPVVEPVAIMGLEPRVEADASVLQRSEIQSGFSERTTLEPFDIQAAPSLVSQPASISEPASEVVAPLAQDGSAWGRMEAQLRPRLPSLVLGWLIGVCLLSLRPLIGWRTSRRLRSMGLSEVDESLKALLRRLADRLGVTVGVALFESSLVPIPCVVGVLKPVILLPLSAINGLTMEQMEALLAHELAHIRRHDLVINVLQTLVETLLFYHPAVWWLSRRVRQEREHCCDDMAIHVCGDAASYARMLVSVESLRASVPQALLAANGGSLVERIRRLVRAEETPVRTPWVTLCAAALMCVLLATAAHSWPTAADEQEPTRSQALPRVPAEAAEQNPSLLTPLPGVPGRGGPEPDAELSPARSFARIRGIVVDPEGLPIPGVEVLEKYSLNRQSMEWDSPTPGQVLKTQSGPDGRFELMVPVDHYVQTLIVTTQTEARADGVPLMGVSAFFEEDVSKPIPEQRIVLKPATRLEVQVADAQGPTAEAEVGVMMQYEPLAVGRTDAAGKTLLFLPADAVEKALISSIHAAKPGVGFELMSYLPREGSKLRRVEPRVSLALSGARTVRVKVLESPGDQPVAGLTLYPWYFTRGGDDESKNVETVTSCLGRTDANGIATFSTIPTWHSGPLTLWPNSKVFEGARCDILGGVDEVTLRLPRLVSISGVVTHADGRAAAGIKIVANGENYSDDDFSEDCVTDRDGRYRMLVPPQRIYLLTVDDPKWGARPLTGFGIEPHQPRENLNFQLQSTTRVFGRVTTTRQGVSDRNMPDDPIAGHDVQITQKGTRLESVAGVTLPFVEDGQKLVQPRVTHRVKTDESGQFELRLGPGQYEVNQTSNSVQKFEITDQPEFELKLTARRSDGDKALQISVISGDPAAAVTDARVVGVYAHSEAGQTPKAQTDANGRADLKRRTYRLVLHAENADLTEAAIQSVEFDAATVTLALQPYSAVTGRLLDANKKPLANHLIESSIHVPYGAANHRSLAESSTSTDSAGRFRLPRIVRGQTSHLRFRDISDKWHDLPSVTVETEAEKDLGDVAAPGEAVALARSQAPPENASPEAPLRVSADAAEQRAEPLSPDPSLPPESTGARGTGT